MFRDSLETIISGVLVFAVGYLLWPPTPGQFYWSAVSDVVGGPVVFLLVLSLFFSTGFVVRKITPINPRNFTTGSLLAYLIGMYLIDTTMVTDSPVHWLGYGLMMASMIFGHAPREILDVIIDGFVSLLDFSASR